MMKNLLPQIMNTVFIDIETVRQHKNYNELSSSLSSLWSVKAHQLAKRSWLDINPQLIEDMYLEKAAIYSEFGKIICISIGMFHLNKGKLELRKKTFSGHDERRVIMDFLTLIRKNFNNPDRYHFCGHNIREFDIPYICRRALIHGIKLPATLNVSGMKSWQLHHLVDTLQLWKFGDYKHYTSLSLLCDIFDIPSPKGAMDGSMVNDFYWKESAMDQIQIYCEEDVEAVALLYCKMIGRSEMAINYLKSKEINHDEKGQRIAS